MLKVQSSILLSLLFNMTFNMHLLTLTYSNKTPGLLWLSFPSCRPDGLTFSFDIRLNTEQKSRQTLTSKTTLNLSQM